MTFANRLKTATLLAGDLALFYLSLYAALLLRYQTLVSGKIWSAHQIPFFYIHLCWLFIFYINNLYEIKTFSSLKIITRRATHALAIMAVLAALTFYLLPGTEITPKTILFIDIAILAPLLILWRKIFWSLAKKGSKTKVLFFGSSKEVEETAKHLGENAQIGYEPTIILAEMGENLPYLIKHHDIQLIVASENIMRSPEGAKMFYEQALPLGVSIISFPDFYEIIFGKIPLSMVNEIWFLENLREINKKSFEITKRVFDILGAVLLGLPALSLMPFVALAIKINSSGNVFYKHERVGKNGKIFKIIKFRSMVKDAEKNGAVWATTKDERITKVGSVLRKTRIDELPQLWNILKGELSFVGPRPERPEFVKTLEEKIPHYSIRHLVKPGASGWAQINYPYGASVEDAIKKLQYDLYYIKNRSVTLDLSIFLKTIMVMLRSAGR